MGGSITDVPGGLVGPEHHAASGPPPPRGWSRSFPRRSSTIWASGIRRSGRPRRWPMSPPRRRPELLRSGDPWERGTEKAFLAGSWREPFSPGNPPLAVVATPDDLSREELIGVARMAHGALFRSIRTVHTPMDGDIGDDLTWEAAGR